LPPFSNLIKRLDGIDRIRYNKNMEPWNAACDKCAEGEHGVINERGNCLCCGTIVDEELYVQERLW
jgi:hypothetical protein